MNQAAILPTNHDEDWRYADPDWLAAAEPDALAAWKEIAIAPDETRSRTLVLDDEHPGLHRVRLMVGEGARAEIFAIVSANAYTRLEVEVVLAKGAHFEFGGVTIGGNGPDGLGATREFVTRVNHAAESSSNQVVRAVHWGRATGNFLGRIEIPEGSQKVDSAQNFKAILLEKGASANAKPELEINADDVKAAHGAAIGSLDERAGFYMAARGIPPEVARRLLVRAFIADAFEAMGDEAGHDALLERAIAALNEEAI